jgi:prepilin-type processing-associated H-X9-DG protein
LVELLVVIGIIAVLVAILLPALTAARKQAMAVKCAAQLREIGNAFAIYASESKGWFPPAQLQPAAGLTYNIDGTPFPQQGLGAYWYHFLQKYVTKTKLGYASSNANDRADARKSVLWACPVWEGYQSAAYTGGVNVNQPGIGMNVWPTFTASYPTPPTSYPPTKDRVFIQNWGAANQVGNFQRQVVWGRQGAERALVGDSLFWEIEAPRVPATGIIGQAMAINTVAAGNHAFSLGNTLVDCYRHGKYPPLSGDGFSHKKDGGKVAFNMLYADGHVSTEVDRTQAFRALRQRFPD